MPTALKRKSLSVSGEGEAEAREAKVSRNKKSRRDVVVEVDEEVDEDEEMGSPSGSSSSSSSSDNGAVEDEEQGEDSWTGIPTTTTPSHPTTSTTSNKPTTTSTTTKPPTALELRSITDASTLFHSSSFKLQIDALLPSVRPKVFSSSTSGSSRGQALDRFLLELHSILTSLPPSSHQPPIHPLHASSSLSSPSTPSSSQAIAVPYPLPLPTSLTQHKVSFPGIGPITLLGSWATKTSIKPKDGREWGVDLGVEMRGEMFTEKDYLNSRYFHKRAFWLAKVAEGIREGIKKEKREKVEMYYESPNGDPRLTKLVLVPKEKELERLGVRVYIIPVLPSSTSTSSSASTPAHPIPIHRLGPTQCNLRITSPTSTSTSEEKTEEGGGGGEDRLPTPIYNTTLLLSLLPRLQLLSQHSLINAVPSFRDALALVRVWANQRGYSDAGGGGDSRGDSRGEFGNGNGNGKSGNGKGERAGYKVVAGFEGRGYLWGALLEFIVVGEEPSTMGKGAGVGGGGGGGGGNGGNGGGAGAGGKKGRKGLGRGLSSYQMFRGVLDLLAKHDFTLHPLLTKTSSSSSSEGHKFTKEEYLAASRGKESREGERGGVFVGSDGLVNLLSGIPVGSLNLLRHDALKTLETLDNKEANGDPFKDVWLTEERGLAGRFDEVVCIDLSSARQHTTSLPQILAHGSPTSSLLHQISSLLHLGLGDRVKVIALLHQPLGLRKVSEANPESIGKVWIGVIFSEEGRAFRVVDHGPSLSSSSSTISSSSSGQPKGEGEGGEGDEEHEKKVREFKELWGEKSELRRFKDGRIGESVVWSVGSLEERREVPRMVVQYLLRYHFGISSISFASGGNEKDDEETTAKDTDTNMEPKPPQSRNQYTPLLLLLPSISSIYLNSYSNSQNKISTGTKGALGAFDALVRTLKSLSSSPSSTEGGREGRGGEAPIPLSILNVHPVSPALRYTSTFSPLPLPSSISHLLPPFSTSTGQGKWVEEMEILVEFERSSRWGDELRYVESMKMAFLERVGGELMGAVPGLVARVVVPPSSLPRQGGAGGGGEGRGGGRGGAEGRGGGEELGRDESYLEVLTPEGWAFKLRIWVDREAVLLDRAIQDSLRPIPPALLPSSSTTTTTSSAAQIKLELAKKARLLHQAKEKKELYQRRYVMGPRHHRAVGNLVHRYHAYAGTVRLVKRWFGGHWLLASSSSSSYANQGQNTSDGLDAVSEEAIEILVARVFIGDGSDLDHDLEEGEEGKQERPSVPGSKERGFALVMRMLKDWDWTQEGGLEVRMYGSRAAISYGEEEEVQGSVSTTTTGNATANTAAGKKANKNLLLGGGSGSGTGGEEAKGVWKLVTEVDPTGKMWTKYGPDGVVAQRIRALAGATWEVLCKGMEGGCLDVKAMFVHPTEDYDVLIRLDRSVLPRYHQNVTPSLPDLFPQRKGKYVNIASSSSDVIVRPGFDPARLLFHDLQRVYRNTFKIFHDVYGGDTYGIVWDPSLKEERGFRVFGRYSMRPVESTEPEKRSGGKEKKEKNLVKLNEAAILDEIERMGRGLVKEIVVQVGGKE